MTPLRHTVSSPALNKLGKLAALSAASPIARSWERCAGLDYALNIDPSPLMRADLQVRQEQHALLLQVAQPELNTLASMVSSAKNIILLADASGVILHEEGSTEFLQKAERVALLPGVCWSESQRGTNAIGTALLEGTAVRVHGSEHFLECNKSLSCHAAPVFSPRGDIIGVLDISGDAAVLQAYAMGLAQICARQISNRLMNQTDARLHRLVFQRQRSQLDTAERAILLLEEDRIVGANDTALDVLGGDWGLLDNCVKAWLDGWESLTANNGEPQQLHTRSGAAIHAFLYPGRNAIPPTTMHAVSAPRPKIAAIAQVPSVNRHGEPLPALSDELNAGLQQAASAIDTGMAILLQGETGAGKEIFARHLHERSHWHPGPFVAVNCGALPESLIESELFGYEGGAFTGARREGSRGRLRQAHGGVLFLDEIGDMPLLLQTRLLRALQEREVQPLGSDKRIPVDFGLISATNHDLAGMIKAGNFRTDLYYRLQDFSIELPPLRQRQWLPQYICQEFKRLGAMDRGMTLADSALAQLAAYPWPGNYRELQSVLRRLVLLLPAGSVVHAAHLPTEIAKFSKNREAPALRSVAKIDQAASPTFSPGAPDSTTDSANTAATLRDISAVAIEHAIIQCGNNISSAARLLGVHRSTLYRYLRRR